MDLGTRAVYGTQLVKIKGRVKKVPFVTTRGNPVQYAKAIFVKHPQEAMAILERQALWEAANHEFVPGKKMNGNSFWRDALRYAKKHLEKK